jgi:hypothetical protein
MSTSQNYLLCASDLSLGPRLVDDSMVPDNARHQTLDTPNTPARLDQVELFCDYPCSEGV